MTIYDYIHILDMAMADVLKISVNSRGEANMPA